MTKTFGELRLTMTPISIISGNFGGLDKYWWITISNIGRLGKVSMIGKCNRLRDKEQVEEKWM